MEFLRNIFGLSLNEKEKEMKKLVENSYTSLRVIGRGTVSIDSSEVRARKSFKEDCIKAKSIVENAI